MGKEKGKGKEMTRVDYGGDGVGRDRDTIPFTDRNPTQSTTSATIEC